MAKNPTPSTGTSRSDKVAAMKAQETAKARRTKIATWGGVAALILAIGIGTAYGMSSTEKVEKQAAPKVATTGLAIPVGDEDAPIVLDVYEDFQCPACSQFEEIFGTALDSAVDDGDVRINYHMMAFLGPESVRASAAGACAADADKFAEFHKWAYANQPVEHSGGFTEDDLLAAGEQLNFGADYAQCVKDDVYSEYGPKVDAEAAKKGVTGTPTVFIDGTKVDPARVLDTINASLAESTSTTIAPEPKPNGKS